MTRTQIWKIVEKPDFDNLKFVEDISNKKIIDASKFDLYPILSVVDEFRDDFIRFILDYSFTRLLERSAIMEAFVGKTTSSTSVTRILHLFLNNLGNTTNLIIIDPYFFPKVVNASYIKDVEDALSPILQNLKEIIFIVKTNYDLQISTNVKQRLLSINPSLTIGIKTSDDYHDRCWISQTTNKGFLMGTSLNGLGKKHALIDNLDLQDVDDLINQLKKESLL